MIKLLGIILFIILVLLLIAVVRTLLLPKKESSYHPCSDEERSMSYAKKLQKMIQVETVSNADKPDPDKFRKLHKVMEELFPHVFAQCEKYDLDGNLLVRWQGKNQNLDPIILISHLDVVPAEGEWNHDPFAGEISDGLIYGRGALDVKNGVFAFYQALEEMIIDGYQPECDVYLGSSCTEEVGGDGAPKIVNWFKERGIKLYMLCDEGGAIVENPISGVKGNFAAIGIFEKGYADLKFTAKGIGGHSSAPKKNTPIARLAAFINEVETKNPFRTAFTPAVKGMFRQLAPYCSIFYLKMALSNLWLFSPLIKKVMPALSAQAAAMLHTTICFTMQKGSNASNVIPQEAYVTANLRFIPFQDRDESIEVISKLAKQYDLETEVLRSNHASKELDLNGPQFDMVSRVVNKVFPDVGVMPYTVTGATDSRFYDDICDSCVRFSPFNYTSDQLARMHGIDENISINTIPLAVDYFKEIVKIQEERKDA